MPKIVFIILLVLSIVFVIGVIRLLIWGKNGSKGLKTPNKKVKWYHPELDYTFKSYYEARKVAEDRGLDIGKIYQERG